MLRLPSAFSLHSHQTDALSGVWALSILLTQPCYLLTCCAGNTIGKRYARTDEIGVPYAVTVDFQTLEGEGVTLRERDTMTQVRSQHCLGIVLGVLASVFILLVAVTTSLSCAPQLGETTYVSLCDMRAALA
jgi:hypothetical protein